MSKARKPGEVAMVDGVKIVGHLNVPGRLAASASALYARNLLAFLETLVDKKEKTLAINWDDELVKATVLTRDGAIVHPNFQPKDGSLTEAAMDTSTEVAPFVFHSRSSCWRSSSAITSSGR